MTEEDSGRYADLRKELQVARDQAEGIRSELSKQNAVLRSRLETLKWLLWAAVFLIVVLIVGRYARAL